jgi:hypothetical protein
MSNLEAQYAEHQRRLDIANQTGDPCDLDAARAVDPRRNDPAYVDVPDWHMIRAEFGRDW